MKQQNDFEQFTENLYHESPRGAYELEAMKYGIMARIGLQEPEALELAVKIVAANKPTKGVQPMSNDLFEGMSYEDVEKALKAYRGENTPPVDPEEAKIREDAEAKIQARRQEKELAPKVLAYKKASYAARGNRQQLAQIRERFARQGVPVQNITFDGTGGASWNGKPIEEE